jgi:hypothetical protein
MSMMVDYINKSYAVATKYTWIDLMGIIWLKHVVCGKPVWMG